MLEIEKLVEKDQEIRNLLKLGEITPEEFKLKNKEVSMVFFDLYKKYGFPYKNENNEDIYRGAVVLTLHQPLKNLEFIFNNIKDCLAEKIDPKDLAFMIDKIHVAKGLMQVYGTQYKRVGGGVEFLPIGNVVEVDKRRNLVGLEPLEEYKKKAS